MSIASWSSLSRLVSLPDESITIEVLQREISTLSLSIPATAGVFQRIRPPYVLIQ